MNKIIKVVCTICLVLVSVSVVHASSKEELMDYLNKEHMIYGKVFTLTKQQKVQVERYLNNSSLTNSKVNMFISKAEEIKTIMNSSKISDPLKLSNSDKTKVMSLIKEMGDSIGIIVVFSSKEKHIELRDPNYILLDTISLTEAKLPFTGTNLMIYEIVLAIVTMMSVICILKRRVV